MRFLRAVLLPLLAGLGLAQDDDGVFINPAGPQRELANTPVYIIGSTVQLRWTVSWDRISLTLYQNGNPDFEYLLPNVSNPNNYNWIVSTDKDYSAQSTTNGTTFFLVGYYPGTNTQFGSHYFNITDKAVATPSPTPTPSSAVAIVVVTVTPTATTRHSSTLVASLSAATTTASSIQPEANTGLSAATKTGLGVGIGIGVPLLVLLGVAIGFMLRARSHKAVDEDGPAIPYAPAGPWAAKGAAGVGSNEMDGSSPRPPPGAAAGYAERYSDKPQPAPPRFMQELPTDGQPYVYEMSSEQARRKN